jgi:hypothetical protein
MNRNIPFLKKRNEPGQSLVLIVIMFFGIIALAALVIDGGSLYLNRRNVQTAVDAAAMAGAYKKCIENGTDAEIYATAQEYAINKNKASQIESVTVDDDDLAVTVRARLETPSFFSIILGFENDTAYAEATAQCFPPESVANYLPIAWTCRPPIGNTSGEECVLHSIPVVFYKQFKAAFFDFTTNILDEGDGVNKSSYFEPGIDNRKIIYLAMDDDKFNPELDCVELNPTGSINCDFDDDGILDVEGGANRGWLELEDPGARSLKDAMRYGIPNPLEIPQWFPAKFGAVSTGFDAAADIQLKIVLLPVFTSICEDTSQDEIPSDCPTEYQSGDLIADISNGSTTYYRISGFSPFVITCVSKNGHPKCPGRTLAGVKGNTSTIEGYFLSGYYEGSNVDPNGNDLGIYTISLVN